MRLIALLSGVLAFAGCTSVGTLGVVTRSSADPAAALRSGREYKEMGVRRGKACRFMLLGAFPWGDADLQSAVDDALAEGHADALVNVTTTNSLYSFIPIYNLLAYTCTTVQGTAVTFRTDSGLGPKGATGTP